MLRGLGLPLKAQEPLGRIVQPMETGQTMDAMDFVGSLHAAMALSYSWESGKSSGLLCWSFTCMIGGP